ncbi:c-type cytochrome [Defluviimonas sp. WL0002]|uniref:C-type cytochrome n=1 Tax=Albidovulum marisflavi TaxID=2984159 RepID=A0ABT2ZDU3_9RHOB|nr:c-type cytochrome [Defluviimonas sp. WL0002]
MALRIASTLTLSFFATASAVLAEGDPEHGRDLARTNCARCHGVDGNARSTSFQPVPMLAGQPAVYLLEQMRNYASGKREDTSKGSAMTNFLRDLTDQDLEDLAAYYAGQARY